MTKRLLPSLAVSALLAGCGTAGLQDARDSREPSEPATPDPGGRPTAAPWPAYPVADYTYTLRKSCFCVDAGVPVTVTVRNGTVADAVYTRAGRGHAAGTPAVGWLRVTINDIIEVANDTDADSVKVRWPAGQAHPASVYVDWDKLAIDEEAGYSIRDVNPTAG